MNNLFLFCIETTLDRMKVNFYMIWTSQPPNIQWNRYQIWFIFSLDEQRSHWYIFCNACNIAWPKTFYSLNLATENLYVPKTVICSENPFISDDRRDGKFCHETCRLSIKTRSWINFRRVKMVTGLQGKFQNYFEDIRQNISRL